MTGKQCAEQTQLFILKSSNTNVKEFHINEDLFLRETAHSK